MESGRGGEEGRARAERTPLGKTGWCSEELLTVVTAWRSHLRRFGVLKIAEGSILKALLGGFNMDTWDTVMGEQLSETCTP